MAIPRVPGLAGRGNRLIFAVTMAWSVALGTRSARAQDQAPPPDPTPVEAGAGAPGGQGSDQGAEADASGGQVLTQGPVHEAFAAPVVHDPQPATTVPKQPPDPIQELPPDQKPSGQNIQWIPGYWAWDVTRNDYLWVSGVWREPPPGSQWVPGYWHNVDGGYQWVPGAWMPASAAPADAGAQASPQSQATYMPPPPRSLEAGPNTPQPGPNVSWTPGYWTWNGGAYAWRPGFWAAVQPNWIWMPPHYVWTPSGYLFVPGYWDLPVANRGLMFAPVYYPQPVYAQAGFAFTPSISIVGSAVTANLFVQPSANVYLFGNYYAQTNVSLGIVPWFSFSFSTGRPAYYDPLFSYYAVVNVRQNPQWIVQVRRAYVMRIQNVALRPPVTYAEQVRVMRNVTITRDITVVDHRSMAMPLHELARDPIAGRNLRMVRVSEAERQQIRRQVAAVHQMREQRAHQEREAARGGLANQPRKMSLPHSPIASHPTARPADHPGGHPAAHGGAEGARATVAHRDAEARGRSESGTAEARRSMPEGRAGGKAARPAARQPAQRGRARPAEEREPERRP